MTDQATEVVPVEKTLILQAIDGDPSCFAALITPHLRAARVIAQRIVRWDQDVDDVLQESAHKALSRLHQFRFESTFGTWLLSIVANEARMARRRTHAGRTVPLDNLLPDDLRCSQPATAVVQCARHADAKRLEHAVSQLPDKYRQVIRLRFQEEADVRQTARALGISISAVKSRQLRALQMMGRLLPRRDFGFGPA